MRSFAETSPHIGRHRQRWHLENLAVGAHHSGQLPSWKLVLEKLMTEGLLEAVFATTTVAAGVNSLDAIIAGIGGCPFAPAATGNIPTEDLLYMLDR